jgi:uncharacterized protein (DUF433 family)
MESLIERNKHTMSGMPIIRGTSISCSTIKYWYEVHSVEWIAECYKLSVEQVKAAINFKRKVKI